jgi:mannose-6-phosphate isomerase-like protein (cupin superfamily)
MVHCALQPGQVTRAARHRSVEEVWYCLAGAGQLWRRSAYSEEVVDLAPGIAVSIPLGVSFQFRTSGAQPLELVITTIPPWPGEAEAVFVEGAWESTT